MAASIVSVRQLDDLRGQLPKDLREVFPDAPVPATA
jgi:hypothetical protein